MCDFAFCTEYGCSEKWCRMSSRSSGINKEQPLPKKNNLPASWDLVLEDMKNRDKVGQERYGARLQPNNGRDQLIDAYSEALDLCVYLRTAIYERDGK